MEIPCANCGKPVTRKPSKVTRSRRIFCSAHCYHSMPLDAGDKRLRSHVVTQETRDRIGRANSREWPKKTCPICSVVYQTGSKTVRNLTCGETACRLAMRSIRYHGSIHHRWKGGGSSHWQRRALSTMADETRPEFCVFCLTQGVLIDGPMHIHHISGDRTDNRSQNLLWACPSCHSKFHYHSALNRNGIARLRMDKA